MENKPLLGGYDADKSQSQYPTYSGAFAGPGTAPSYPPPSAPPYPGEYAYQHHVSGQGMGAAVPGIPYRPRNVGDESPYPSEWTYGLCDCHTNVPLCALTYCCPCVTFGRVASVVDEGATSCPTAAAVWYILQNATGCGWLYSCSYRTKLRRKYNLPEEPMPDFLVHCCCLPCALCQEYKELKYRGLDPEFGWPPREERYGIGQTVAPVQQTMSGNRY